MSSFSDHAPEKMELLESGESYEEIDGEFRYTKTLVVYGFENNIYHAISKSRMTEIKMDELTNVVLIPATAYCPLFPSNFTRAPDPLPSNCYVKRPKLLSYDRIDNNCNSLQIHERVLREAETCESLKLHPHSNVAQYLGCQVRDDRIVGICFTKYGDSLMRRVNPNSRMKRPFQYCERPLKNRDDFLKGIEKGILHLHDLGLIHNDINPANILFDSDDAPIIIDFDSCRSVGQSLEGIGRTYEWNDESVQISLPSNDLDALKEIQEWLSDSDIKTFQFKQ